MNGFHLDAMIDILNDILDSILTCLPNLLKGFLELRDIVYY